MGSSLGYIYYFKICCIHVIFNDSLNCVCIEIMFFCCFFIGIYVIVVKVHYEKTNNVVSEHRSDTNRAVRAQKMARGWKFWILKVEELYYLCSENKGADQLRSYCEADLRLCFRICRLLFFTCSGSFKSFITEWFKGYKSCEDVC